MIRLLSALSTYSNSSYHYLIRLPTLDQAILIVPRALRAQRAYQSTTMRLLDALLALPLIFGISMAAQRADGLLRYNSSDPEVERRWYSIPVDEKAGPDERRPWPLCGNGKRVISYCFGDDRAYRDIGDLFLKGIAKWAHVMHISSVVFAPDTACLGPQWRGRCLCSTPGVKEDSLHIILSDNQASSTVGYLPPSAPNPNPSLPRNNIIWPKHIGFSKAFAPVVMAHEIGEIT